MVRFLLYKVVQKMELFPDNTYFKLIDKTMKELRSYLLGFALNFSDVIPKRMLHGPDEKKAAYLADRLLFGITLLNPISADRATEIRAWLYYIILFLHEHCAPISRTFSGILMISEQSLSTRELMFDEPGFTGCIVMTEPHSPVSRYFLERSIGILISGCRIPIPGQELLERIIKELSDNKECYKNV